MTGVRRRHRRGYKFTEKTQSKRGMAALALAVISIGVLVAVIMNSFWNQGKGSMYLGSAGVAAMLLGVVAFVTALGSLREENSFKLFPYLSTLVSFLAVGVWIALYVVGAAG